MIGNTQTKSDKNIVLTFSLLMRLFEWCHEDAANDVAMHKVMEKLVAFSDGRNALDIQVYKTLIDGANDGEEKDEEEPDNAEATEEDLANAFDLGQRQAENGMDLSNDLTRSAGAMITAVKDNGYGASNNEIEQFCQGYEGKVDADFADYMQNIHDSYREGGITGDYAKDCINNYQQNEHNYDYDYGCDYKYCDENGDEWHFNDCPECSSPMIDQYCQSYEIPSNVLSVDAEGNVEIGCPECQEKQPCEDCQEDDEIEEIVKLAKF